MKVIIIGAAIAACVCTSAHAQTMRPQYIGQWRVGEISRGEPVCRMERTYSNGTVFGVDIFIRSRLVEISIGNRDWRSLNESPDDEGESQGSILTSISYSEGSVVWQGRAKVRKFSALNPEPGIYIKGPFSEMNAVIEGMHTASIISVKVGHVTLLSASSDGLDPALTALKMQCLAPYSYRRENDPFRR